MTDWIKEIRIEELPECYREMTRIIGLENTLRLAEHYGKQAVYFVGLDGLIARKKEEYIRKHFNGSNHKELARATGYSERWVYEIIKRGRDERQSELF